MKNDCHKTLLENKIAGEMNRSNRIKKINLNWDILIRPEKNPFNWQIFWLCQFAKHLFSLIIKSNKNNFLRESGTKIFGHCCWQRSINVIKICKNLQDVPFLCMTKTAQIFLFYYFLMDNGNTGRDPENPHFQ